MFELVIVMKWLATAYDMDLQVYMEGIIYSVDTIKNSLDVLAGILSSLQLNK